MTHRDRVVAAVERFTRRQAPAGFWPIDSRFPWATVAGASLHCVRCGQEGRAPLPRVPGYEDAVLAFLARHKSCEEAA